MPATDKPQPVGGFGKHICRWMISAGYRDGAFQEPVITALDNFHLHPAAHVLHYGSACFEGLKAHRGPTARCAFSARPTMRNG